MDFFQILYTDSPWALVVQHYFFIQIWKKVWSPGSHLEFWTSKYVTAISQQLLDGFFPIFVYRFPLGPSCAISLFYSHLKTNMATRRPSWIWTSKFVTAISQQLLYGLFPNFVYRFPLGPSCATSLFIQVWKPIWPPGGHLEFWTSKFVTTISQRLLDGLFPNFVYGFPLGPSCATSLFYSDLNKDMVVRRPSWILNIKVCYRYFSATTWWIFSKFCIQIPLGPSCATLLFIQIWTKIWSSGGHLEFWTSKFVTAISQQLLVGLFPNFVYRFPLGPSCATSLFYSDLKTNMATRAAILNFEHQSLLPLFLSNYWMDFFQILYTDSPWALVVQHYFFYSDLKKIWSPGGHLEFWTSKYVTAISQQLLDGFFPIFVYRFPLGPSCAISLFNSHQKTNMATRRPSWILNIKVCYRYFSATTVWIVSKFCIQIPLGP